MSLYTMSLSRCLNLVKIRTINEQSDDRKLDIVKSLAYSVNLINKLTI